VRASLKLAFLFLAALLACPASGWAQGTLNQVTRTGTLDAVGDVVEVISSLDLAGGGFGSAKVQTFDSYTGTWEVQCSVDGVTYDTASELKVTPTDSTTVAYSVSNDVAIWDVGNASGCRAIRVISTAGFSGSDTFVALTVTQSGGGGSSSGGGTSDATAANQVLGNASLSSIDTSTATSATNSTTVAGAVSSAKFNVNISAVNGNALIVDPCQGNAKSFFTIDIASGTAAVLITGVSAKKTYICHLQWNSATAQGVSIYAGNGSTCGSNKVKILGGSSDTTGWNPAANGGIVVGNGGYAIAATTVNADDVCIDVSSTGQVSGNGSYVTQ
jgi:hypothetical protein